jgi:hypothetical protein
MKQQITANFKPPYKLSSHYTVAWNSRKMSLKLHHCQDTGYLRTAERQSRWSNEPGLNLYCTLHTERLSRPSALLHVTPGVTSNSPLHFLMDHFSGKEDGKFSASHQWTETYQSHSRLSRCLRQNLRPIYKDEKKKNRCPSTRAHIVSVHWVGLSPRASLPHKSLQFRVIKIFSVWETANMSNRRTSLIISLSRRKKSKGQGVDNSFLREWMFQRSVFRQMQNVGESFTS